MSVSAGPTVSGAEPARMPSGGFRVRLLVSVTAAALAVLAGVPVVTAQAAPPVLAAAGQVRAGAAVVDASWHVGASQGQYADDGAPVGPDAVDPYTHSTKRVSSVGLQSRITTRALVVEGANGKRVAVISHDLYLPQDLLARRVAQLVAEHDRDVTLGLADGPATGLTADAIAMTASHSHGSPYYSTPSAGVWVFQDVYDIRFFEYMATKMAEAIVTAAERLTPVRVGGATVRSNDVTSHSYGPQVATDGTPAGQPWDFTTQTLSVVRFDSASTGAPVATWVVFGMHPEFSYGDNLVTGEVMHTIAKMVDREVGGVTVMSQNETGASGPHKDLRAHAAEDRREFQESSFTGMERAARYVADTVKSARSAVTSGDPETPGQYAPMTGAADVDFVTERFAPPATRPYPGVSNCNMERTYDLEPGVPIAGLPDCEFMFAEAARPITDPISAATNLGAIHDQLRAAGVPIPDSYAPPALLALQESATIRMQAFRIGDIGVTFCACEQFSDQSLNLVSRLDRTPNNLFVGFDWSDLPGFCTQQNDTTWKCKNPKNQSQYLAPITDLKYRRMRAQIHNDAAGWELDPASLNGESEPVDPAQIKGNYTHEEHTANGYGLVLTVGMANDYWGYTPSYREYRQGDHYRKALEAAGPHASDFFATRLARMAASLNGGTPVPLMPQDIAYANSEANRAEAFAAALGSTARAYVAAYQASLPVDGGAPEIVAQPANITRFAAANVQWVGGSTWTDVPDVRVERLVGGAWTSYADSRGEVPIMVAFPALDELPTWRAGAFEWKWTATFEAFTSDLANLGDRPGQTPAGQYRFVVDGRRRVGAPAAEEGYHLESAAFTVSPWGGVTAEDVRVEPGGAVSFTVGPTSTHTFGTSRTYTVGPIDYPDTYTSPFVHIRNERRLYTYGLSDASRHQQYCHKCTFRPWADTATVRTTTVRVERVGGGRDVVVATQTGGRWVAPTALAPGDAAYVEVGGIVDSYGESNAQRFVIAGTPTDPLPVLTGPEPVVPEIPVTGLLPIAALLLTVAFVARQRRVRVPLPR